MMADKWSGIGTAASRAALAVARARNLTGILTHGTDAPVTVYCVPSGQTRVHRHVIGNDAQIPACTFTVPAQTSFPPADGVNVEDDFEFDSQHFVVTAVKTDSFKAIWTLTGEVRQIRSVR